MKLFGIRSNRGQTIMAGKNFELGYTQNSDLQGGSAQRFQGGLGHSHLDSENSERTPQNVGRRRLLFDTPVGLRARPDMPNKENIHTTDARKSPLPAWYPRIVLQDITCIVNGSRRNERPSLGRVIHPGKENIPLSREAFLELTRRHGQGPPTPFHIVRQRRYNEVAFRVFHDEIDSTQTRQSMHEQKETSPLNPQIQLGIEIPWRAAPPTSASPRTEACKLNSQKHGDGCLQKKAKRSSGKPKPKPKFKSTKQLFQIR